jgi:hypothetical protein
LNLPLVMIEREKLSRDENKLLSTVRLHKRSGSAGLFEYESATHFGKTSELFLVRLEQLVCS